MLGRSTLRLLFSPGGSSRSQVRARGMAKPTVWRISTSLIWRARTSPGQRGIPPRSDKLTFSPSDGARHPPGLKGQRILARPDRREGRPAGLCGPDRGARRNLRPADPPSPSTGPEDVGIKIASRVRVPRNTKVAKVGRCRGSRAADVRSPLRQKRKLAPRWKHDIQARHPTPEGPLVVQASYPAG